MAKVREEKRKRDVFYPPFSNRVRYSTANAVKVDKVYYEESHKTDPSGRITFDQDLRSFSLTLSHSLTLSLFLFFFLSLCLLFFLTFCLYLFFLLNISVRRKFAEIKRATIPSYRFTVDISNFTSTKPFVCALEHRSWTSPIPSA